MGRNMPFNPPDCRGWAWKLTSSQKWDRVYIKCTPDSTLELYRTPEATAPILCIALPEASLREATLDGLLPHGVATHGLGLVLTSTAPSSRDESPRAVTELQGSSLDLTQATATDASRPRVELILAGDDAVQQSAWTSVLKDRVASASMLPPSMGDRVPVPSAAAVAAPPAALLRWIAADRTSAPLLVTSLHAARSALLSTQRGSALLISDPAAGVQAPLTELQRCFEGLEVRLIAAAAGGGGADSLGPAEAASARKWLQNAGSYCKAAGASLLAGESGRDGGGYVVTAAAAAAALESAETALLDEIAYQKRAALDAKTGTPERRLLAAGRVRPSAQPYARFWAKKIAV